MLRALAFDRTQYLRRYASEQIKQTAMSSYIPFNRPPITGQELNFIRKAIELGELSGNGLFGKQCEAWIADRLKIRRALLTHSCTGALEMAAILADLKPGDEVILPSFTFVSTATAVALRGATPVFVDIREDTLNIDERLVEGAITSHTKAIFVVHYAGVCAEMDRLQAIATQHRLLLVEDAAQALFSTYRGKMAGTLGDLACFSFHETKNIVSGEGGALVVTERADLADRAQMIRDKGTNRARFMLGLVDKYSWTDLGSSYVPSEIVAAFLRAQLDEADAITETRRAVWARYHDAFSDLEARDIGIRRPIVPDHCKHNGHLYYLLLRDRASRDALIGALRERQILAPFHYVPLHSSEAGRRYGRAEGQLTHTDSVSERLIRLPMWYGMRDEADRVIDLVHQLAA
jgi:dTDP-4-amino-4,6-dideoxygalactose transaminase